LSTYDLLRRCRKAFFYGDQRLANLVNFEVPLNGGTGAGKNVQLDWAASTNSHYCNQLVRVTFADGSVSGPTRSGH